MSQSTQTMPRVRCAFGNVFIAIFPVCQMNNFTFGAQRAQAAVLEDVDDLDDLLTVCNIGKSPMVLTT